jgi:hypothetical protein
MFPNAWSLLRWCASQFPNLPDRQKELKDLANELESASKSKAVAAVSSVPPQKIK